MTCWVQSTGAALTRFAVNTPAAAADGPSLTTTATSGCPDSLIPAAIPAARNPAGAVTLMIFPRSPLGPRRALVARVSWRHPAGGEARRFGQAEHEVGVLNGLPGGSLAEVVDGRDHGGPAGPGIGRGLQVHGVRPGDRARGGPASVGEHAHERLARVGLGETRAQAGARAQPRRAGREYPAG